jgi:hypothetical protein
VITAGATLDDLKNASDVLANAATVVAILIGAGWAYWRFLRERTRWPRAALALEFTERRLDDATVFLAVKLHVTNEGRGLMRLTELRWDLHRVLPLDAVMRGKLHDGGVYHQSGVEADWPLIDQRTRSWSNDERPELEPGESDEYCCDFFVSASEQTVFLYAYLENEKKKRGNRKLGWTATAFRDMAQQPSSWGGLTSLLPGGDK